MTSAAGLPLQQVEDAAGRRVHGRRVVVVHEVRGLGLGLEQALPAGQLRRRPTRPRRPGPSRSSVAGAAGRRWPSTQRPTVAWAARNGGRSGSSGGSTTASSHGTYGSADRNRIVGGRSPIACRDPLTGCPRTRSAAARRWSVRSRAGRRTASGLPSTSCISSTIRRRSAAGSPPMSIGIGASGMSIVGSAASSWTSSRPLDLGLGALDPHGQVRAPRGRPAATGRRPGQVAVVGADARSSPSGRRRPNGRPARSDCRRSSTWPGSSSP